MKSRQRSKPTGQRPLPVIAPSALSCSNLLSTEISLGESSQLLNPTPAPRKKKEKKSGKYLTCSECQKKKLLRYRHPLYHPAKGNVCGACYSRIKRYLSKYAQCPKCRRFGFLTYNHPTLGRNKICVFCHESLAEVLSKCSECLQFNCLVYPDGSGGGVCTTCYQRKVQIPTKCSECLEVKRVRYPNRKDPSKGKICSGCYQRQRQPVAKCYQCKEVKRLHCPFREDPSKGWICIWCYKRPAVSSETSFKIPGDGFS